MSPIPPIRRFLAAIGIVTLAAAPWLVDLVRFALKSDLYSHTILIPFVAAWLIWIRRETQPALGSRDGIGTACCTLGAIASVIVAYQFTPAGKPGLVHVLTWMTAAYVLLLAASAFYFLGRAFMRANYVAVCFLAFTVPFPLPVEVAIETALQRASAEAAYLFYSASGLPFLRDGQVFTLPGITLEIAQECSGIHSSLVLFITSIVAGQLLLPPGWKRWVLTLFVIPLAILRNGFRVWVLGELCVRIGPHMIHHWIHHHGGPIFFALSLIPFFALLFALHRVGRRTRAIPLSETAAVQVRPPSV